MENQSLDSIFCFCWSTILFPQVHEDYGTWIAPQKTLQDNNNNHLTAVCPGQPGNRVWAAFTFLLNSRLVCAVDCEFSHRIKRLHSDYLLCTSCAVEFPAVLLNTRSGEIEAEFHQYVQPQENPILSDFCKQLTGISQVSCLLQWLLPLGDPFVGHCLPSDCPCIWHHIRELQTGHKRFTICMLICCYVGLLQ